jgi:drug/metabolite transporter (DMT)-like permease
VDYAITLVAALLLGVGFVLQQQSAETAPQSHFLSFRLFGDLFRKRKWLAGIGCMILGQILAAWSIGHLALSVVEPLLTTNLLVALILAVPLSHQAVRVTEVAGALLLIAGETILSLARSIEPIGQSFGSFSHWPAAAVIAGIAFIAVQAGRRRSGRHRATLTGLGAGLVFGIQDALTRQTLQILQHHGMSGLLHSWSAYCLVATGAVGILLMQSAFNAGPLHSSLPTITAGEPVAGILLGIVVFGDRISLSPASLAMHAGGLAALVLGVILVARAPALSNLRKAVVEPVHLPRLRDTGPHRIFHHDSGPAARTADSGEPARAAPGPPEPGEPAPPRVPGPPAASAVPGPSAASAVPAPSAAPGPSGLAGPPGAPGPVEPAPSPSRRSRKGGFALPAQPPTPVPPDPPRLPPAGRTCGPAPGQPEGRGRRTSVQPLIRVNPFARRP